MHDHSGVGDAAPPTDSNPFSAITTEISKDFTAVENWVSNQFGGGHDTAVLDPNAHPHAPNEATHTPGATPDPEHTPHGATDPLVDPAVLHTDANTTTTDPNAPPMVGNPEYDMSFWHHQESQNSCAIASQQYIIEQLTGQQVSESDLAQQAEQHGWYTPDQGTPQEDCGKLLELYGLETHQYQNSSIDDLSAQLAQGHGVFVAVHGETILAAADPSYAASISIADATSIPGQNSDHAIEVIGIDRSDPDNPKVILNDPDGTAGETVPLSTFETAWSASNNFMVAAW